MISLRRFLRSERPLENGPQALSHTIMRALAAAAKGGNTKAIMGALIAMRVVMALRKILQ